MSSIVSLIEEDYILSEVTVRDWCICVLFSSELELWIVSYAGEQLLFLLRQCWPCNFMIVLPPLPFILPYLLGAGRWEVFSQILLGGVICCVVNRTGSFMCVGTFFCPHVRSFFYPCSHVYIHIGLIGCVRQQLHKNASPLLPRDVHLHQLLLACHQAVVNQARSQ